jgi:tRNA G18 (ribose-2'-O)-methylase SpoU
MTDSPHSSPGRAGSHRRDAGSDTAPGPTEWSVPAAGAGPWVGPLPDDPRYDPELLRDGDTRNVVDAYRYWTREAIVADIDKRRHPLHVAIENFGQDANIGGVVRAANAFAVDTVHIVGRRRWNRRGAMVTDRYQRLQHHDTTAELLRFAVQAGLTVVAVDIVPGAARLEQTALPRNCLLLFGQEGPGISDAARDGAALTVSIAQFGSTRSINVAVAAGIAMHTWISQHGDMGSAW